MLIAYDTDGVIRYNSGSNSEQPLGPDDEVVELITGRTDLTHKRLHDADDASDVELVLEGRAKVRAGKLIEVERPTDPSTPPVVVPEPGTPTTQEILQMIVDLQAQSQRLQDQSDQLTLLIGGGL